MGRQHFADLQFCLSILILAYLYSKMTGRSRTTETMSLLTLNEVSFGRWLRDHFGESASKN